MIATIFSSSVSFVVPSAFAISVFLLWTFIAAQHSHHLDRRTKIAMWLVVFPILALTLKSLRLLAGMR
jgi:purine-cytosine permease-like protein